MLTARRPNIFERRRQCPRDYLAIVNESVAALTDESLIDEEKFVIRRVKVVGLSSINGRDYPPQVIRAASTLYEGAPVYIDHIKPGMLRPNTYGESVGMLKNFTTTDQGGFADLHLNPGHPRAKQVLWDATNRPESFGLSHHADIEESPPMRGRKTVRKIEHVYSVDIVKRPATNKGLFESVTEDMVDIGVPAERLAEKGGDAAREFLVKVRAAFTKPGYTVDQAMKEVARLVDEFEASLTQPAKESAPPPRFNDNADRVNFLRGNARTKGGRSMLDFLRGNSSVMPTDSLADDGAADEDPEARRQRMIQWLRR